MSLNTSERMNISATACSGAGENMPITCSTDGENMKTTIVAAVVIGVAIIVGFVILTYSQPVIEVTPDITVTAEAEKDYYTSLSETYTEIRIMRGNRVVSMTAGEGEYSEYYGFFPVMTRYGLRIHMIKRGEAMNGDTDMFMPDGDVELRR
jgi:hypothetical protein